MFKGLTMYTDMDRTANNTRSCSDAVKRIGQSLKGDNASDEQDRYFLRGPSARSFWGAPDDFVPYNTVLIVKSMWTK